MCGLDVTEQAWFPRGFSCPCRTPPSGALPARQRRAHRKHGPRRGRPNACDVCPVLYLTHPELFTGRQAGVHVETRGTVTYAKTVTDLDSDAENSRSAMSSWCSEWTAQACRAHHGGTERYAG